MSRRPGRAAIVGLSLVELLVAIGIGGLLVGGTIRIFISNREAYEYNTALSELQDAGRIALELMMRDIRHAGQFGCGGDDLYEVTNASLSPEDYARHPGRLSHIGRPGKASAVRAAAASGAQDRYVSLSVEGFDGWASWARWLPSGGVTTATAGTGTTKRDYVPVANTDGITVRYLLPSNRYTNVRVSNGNLSSPALFFRNLKVLPGKGDPDTGILVGTGGGSTLIAPPDMVGPIDTLPGSSRGINRRRSKAWDRLEYGVYWFENPD